MSCSQDYMDRRAISRLDIVSGFDMDLLESLRPLGLSEISTVAHADLLGALREHGFGLPVAVSRLFPRLPKALH